VRMDDGPPSLARVFPLEGEPGHEQMIADDLQELARLRSDEWLEKAAKHIAQNTMDLEGLTPEQLKAESTHWLLVLRRYRDGKA
jgi:hypothetical protein